MTVPHVPSLAASLPPGNLPGLDPAWSRLVTVADATGEKHVWHVLDNGVEPEHGTLVCVHGNPTWSYLWRRFVEHAPPGWRVVAPDHLGMGFSDRLTAPRTLAQRIDDLDDVLRTLGVRGPVAVAAHDWGGAISLGWAARHRERLRGIVLTNTAVHQPADSSAPTLIRLARTRALRTASCVTTPTFVRTTGLLSRPALPAAVREALAAPYATAARRVAVGGFVADIPLEPGHVSFTALEDVKSGLEKLADVPALLLWGPRDPVFSDRYLRDLQHRLPHADVHRYEGASHLVTEDAPRTATDAWRWIGDVTGSRVAGSPNRSSGPLLRGTLQQRSAAAAGRGERTAAATNPAAADHRSDDLWTALTARAGDPAPAVVELTGGRTRTISFALLEQRVRELAAGFAEVGIGRGDRVALLVPPGADLTATVYACWQAGATVVVADQGLGPAGLARALRGSGPDHVVGIAAGLGLARALGIPGARIAAGELTAVEARALGARHRLADVAALGREVLATGRPAPQPAGADDEAAILFTSGATGPAKGALYRHRQLQAQLATLRAAYGITAEDRLVAAFPPFALYGPALGIGSAAPDAPQPGTLTARGLADAVTAIDATVVFASIAVMRNVVATADALTPDDRRALEDVRLVVSAGAPVPAGLGHALRAVLPGAQLHTPYGMTEALPLTDISLDGIDEAGPGDGVCVGRPLPGVEIRIAPFTGTGTADELVTTPGVSGEICARAAHVKERYDQLWATERDSARTTGWHRTSDVGHLDDEGRLWVGGRLAHVVRTAGGPVTPVGVEQRVEALDDVTSAAVAGIGPDGTAQTVVVVVADSSRTRPAAPLLADDELTAAVRDAAGVPVAAVLVTDRFPVDIRHASKIDRTRVSAWADRVLAGEHTEARP